MYDVSFSLSLSLIHTFFEISCLIASFTHTHTQTALKRAVEDAPRNDRGVRNDTEARNQAS